MVMTSDQIAAELQRKRNLGKAPDNPANQAIYDKLTPQAAPTFNAYGGKDSYAANQNTRFQAANESGDTDLISRLQADSKRAGYALNPYTPKTTTTTTNNNASTNPTSSDLLTNIRDYMNKQASKEIPQFNYDPNSDPVYQSALSRAKANSDTASGNAQAELNRRGILNSTITSDRLGQIQQAEYGRVSDEILPQLFQQAYGRYRDTVGDQYTAGRDELNDLGKLLDYQTGREDTQYGRDYQTGRDTRNDAIDNRNYNRGVLESDRGFDRGVLESDRGFDRGVLESDRGYNRGVLESDRGYNLDKSRENRISSGGGSGGGSSGGGTTKLPSLTSYANLLQDQFMPYDPVTRTRKVTNPDALERTILSSGYSEAQMQQLYDLFGLNLDSGNSLDRPVSGPLPME